MHLPPRRLIRTHKGMQVAMISEYFDSVIRLLEVVTPMTETFNNSKKLSIMDLVVSFSVDYFA